MSVKEAHTVVDSIVCKSPRCMMAWSMLSPLLFRASQRSGKKAHMLTIALHQIGVFASEYQKTGVANEELLEIAVEVLGGSAGHSSSDENSVEHLPPKKRMIIESRPISVLGVKI